MDKEKVITLIAREIVKAGNRENFGAMFGISSNYIGKIVRGERDIPQSVLDYIGVERVEEIKYRRKKCHTA